MDKHVSDDAEIVREFKSILEYSGPDRVSDDPDREGDRQITTLRKGATKLVVTTGKLVGKILFGVAVIAAAAGTLMFFWLMVEVL